MPARQAGVSPSTGDEAGLACETFGSPRQVGLRRFAPGRGGLASPARAPQRSAQAIQSSVMARLRRTIDAPRLEVLPLIDVIFLLLTFFIYALVLVVRAELLPVELPQVAAGTPAEASRPIVVTLDSDGRFYVGTDPAEDVQAVIAALREIRDERPDDPLFLAADRDGTTDRHPAFFALVDALREAGVGDFSIMGQRPGDEPPP